MNRKQIWNKEYGAESKLLTKSLEPQAFIRRLFKFLKKRGVAFSATRILDLGCGNGRNLIFFSKHGSSGVGIDISDKAIAMAKKNSLNTELDFQVGNIGETLVFQDDSFDLALDITASNALNEAERLVYLSEVRRVLKPDGYFFVRALCLEGDKNAKKLIENFPGPEAGTYIMPGVGLVERVFSRENFLETYQDFELLELKKESGYSQVGNQKFKRNFWLALMQK